MSGNNSLKPPGADLKRVASYTWPAGHVGQLSEPQSAALEEFKTLCQQKGYYTPTNPETQTSASHDDETLLRYLRARKFIPKDAFGQFKTTEDWRKENQLDCLYEGIDIKEYEQTRRLYPQWTGRRDNRGIPVYVFEVANVKYKDIAAYENDADREKGKKGKDQIKSKVPRKMLRLFALYENLCQFVLPLCSAIPNRPNAETPVSQSNNIVDISKVGLKQFWNLRSHLQDSSALATAHYPETLDRIFVIGAPSFFPTVWDWVKNWFDPITVAKIQIVPDGKKLEVLSKFIPVENIPKKYGGQLDWSFGDMPFLEDQIVDAMKWREDIKEKGHRTFPIGPIKWQYDEEGDLVAVGVGSENGTPRKVILAGLHPEAGVARLAFSVGTKPVTAAKTDTPPARETDSTPARETDTTPTRKTETNGQPQEPDTMASSTTPASPTAITTGSSPTAANGAEAKQFNTLAASKLIDSHSTQPTIIEPTTQTAPDPEHIRNADPDSHLPETSRAGTYTVPYHDKEVASPPADSRQGTSSTRFEQQGGTHAEGQLADGTPNTTIDGQGTSHTVIEPRTVGQAPKETPLHHAEDEAKSGVLLEQAQTLAGQAAGTVSALPGVVLGAVGLGGSKGAEEEVKEEMGKKEDGRVDDLDDRVLEEFVRDQSMTKQMHDKAGG